MKITFIDDSISFDSYTASMNPLGGAEKALAALASALATKGHEITVLNRIRYPMHLDGIKWLSLNGSEKPASTDILVAYRKPELLETIRKAGKRVLWTVNHPSSLQSKSALKMLNEHEPLLLLSSPAQLYKGKAKLFIPGVNSSFLENAPLEPQPTAIVTTHPAHGLSFILDLWKEKIIPALPQARLQIFSNLLLNNAPEVEELNQQIRQIPGVQLLSPVGDMEMAGYYRQARLHLYPSHEADMMAWTLKDSQACGLPGVARPLGGVPFAIKNGETGYLAPDAAAFANLTLELLTNEDMFYSLSQAAKLGGRSWEDAAADFEKLVI